MTVAQFFGCSMIAFGPPLVMFILTIAKDPVRIIMLVASAFFWLLALLFSSILFMIVTPLKDTIAFGAIFSVLFQELFRYLWFLLIQKAEVGLRKVSEGNVEIVENKHILAYVSGLGFGIISGIFSLVNVLADMTGPGTIGLKGEPRLFFVASAYTSLAFILLQVFWGILFFNALYKKKYFQLAYVIASHLAATSITLLNPLYAVTIPLVWILTVLSGVFAFVAVGGSPRTIRNALQRNPQVVQIQVSASRTSINASAGPGAAF
ncbi:UNVERIFIED_CONTAM: hypothetical protein GTU68_023253 [Idotea baltica]|nr:hypothetical protein [Idotea baltica]